MPLGTPRDRETTLFLLQQSALQLRVEGAQSSPSLFHHHQLHPCIHLRLNRRGSPVLQRLLLDRHRSNLRHATLPARGIGIGMRAEERVVVGRDAP